jgi:hypothetical protein
MSKKPETQKKIGNSSWLSKAKSTFRNVNINEIEGERLM